MYPDSAPAAALRDGGALVCRDIDEAVRALAVLAARPPRRTIPSNSLLLRIDPIGEGYFAARELVAHAGIPVSEARHVRSLDEARDAAHALGYPVVFKGLGREHKSDGGGVVLGIADDAALADAYRTVGADECSVERLVDTRDGVELIVGTRRDARFGLLLLVGLGGIYAEVFRDVAVALAPVEPEQAEELLRSLRCAPLLDGARGRTAVDVAAAARVASALSGIGAEVEINPLLVTAAGAVALDARVTMERL
jgi:acyl-CoA synthetase (NDP forming)